MDRYKKYKKVEGAEEMKRMVIGEGEKKQEGFPFLV